MRLTLFLFAYLLTSVTRAEVIEEIVVTGSYVESSPPAQRVVRKADNLLLKVHVTNDARDEQQRKSEIHETLLSAISAASKVKNIELSSVTPNGFVLPLNKSNYRIDLTRGNRPDTNQAYFRVKTKIQGSGDNPEVLLSNMKRFVASLKMKGRTLAEPEGDVEVSIINPGQYRPQVIELMAADVKQVTSALGPDYRVVLTGIDRPAQWSRLGSTDVVIFVPYEYIVLPTSVSSFNVSPDY